MIGPERWSSGFPTTRCLSLGLAFAAACGLFAPRPAAAASYYVATTGSPGPAGSNNNAGTAAAPFATIARAVTAVQPGDTIFLRGGTYTGGFNIGMRNNAPLSGRADAWITFSAYPGELPILDGGSGGNGTGFGSASSQFIRVVGIAARNFGSSGFGNGWVNDVGASNGNWQFVNCIADNNLINGITFYNASGLLIDESIVAHNGNGSSSWSSGVNLFHVSGDFTTNVIRRNVSFENIDISTTHSVPAGGATDGSGFILDQSSSGALFENNLGFRNGGSCIRINTPGAHIINNTCYHNGLNPNDRTPSNPGEIYFSNGLQGAVVMNNLLTASGFNGTMNAVNVALGAANVGNVSVNANGATPFFENPAALDFRLVATASAEIDRASTSSMPATDIGFDPKCIKAQTPQAGQPAWWTFTIDYDYIRTVGGVVGCFHPATRPSGAAPDVGAFEFDGVPAGVGGAVGGGGATGAGGAVGAGGARGTGGATGGGGARGTGGAPLGGGGSTVSGAGGGNGGEGGNGGSTGGTLVDGSGCQCVTAPANRGFNGFAIGLGVAALLVLRARRRYRR